MRLMRRDTLGSRMRGNMGGSGAAKTRQDWAIHKHNPKNLLVNGAFKSRGDIDLYLSSPLIICLECGQDCRSLGHHLSRTHSMSSKEYKRKYNIPLGLSLRCESTRSLSSKNMTNWWKVVPDSEKRRESLRQHAKEKLVNVGQYAERHAHFEKPVYSKACLTCSKVFHPINKYVLKKKKYCSKKCHTASEKEQKRMRIIGAMGGKIRAITGKKDSAGKFA